MPVVMQSQVPTIHAVQKQRQVRVIQNVQKTVEVPQVPYSDRDMDVLVIKEQQVLMIQKTVQKSISELDECCGRSEFCQRARLLDWRRRR